MSVGERALIDRRGFLIGFGAAGMGCGALIGTAYTQTANAADYTIRIAPLRLELAPGKTIDTFAYNGVVPGPTLRLREGREVNIDIRNDTDVDDIIHWHGLYVPSRSDGAMEEGSPMVRCQGVCDVTRSCRSRRERAGTTATTWPKQT
jgi:FtsP/CotA-like multicopper oxidase with cupredoxin domain